MPIDPGESQKIRVKAVTLATLATGESTAEKLVALSVAHAKLPIGAISVGRLNPKEPEHG